MKILPRPLLTILMISFLLIPGIGAGARGDISTSFIETRFLLWDQVEKMMDPDITIHLFNFNGSSNNTASYKIQIDDIEEEGQFQGYMNRSYDLGNYSRIGILKVQINNETVLNGTGILIVEGISSGNIGGSGSGISFIEIPPWEWDRIQWNQFFSVVIAVLLSALWFGYRGMKKIRNKKGGSVIASN